MIGAGIAGLSACVRLQECGFDTIILEARERCGGRIWTDNNSLGIPFGLGAGWIHGVENNPIAKLAKDAQAKTVVVNPSKFITYAYPHG